MTNHERWLKWLANEQEQSYYKAILALVKEQEKKFLVTPDPEYRLRALKFDNIDDIKVIITDTEPRVQPYAADGLAWSTYDEPDRMLSLIYKKLYRELGVVYNQEDNTKDRWAEQGILLLNMEQTRPLVKKTAQWPWQKFTLRILQYFLNLDEPKAFLLLDKQSKNIQLNDGKHLVLRRDIDSQDFLQISTFSLIDNFLARHYGVEIDWS